VATGRASASANRWESVRDLTAAAPGPARRAPPPVTGLAILSASVHACSGCGAKVEAGSKFCGSCGAPLAASPAQPHALPRFASPEAYTPKHLAEKILTSKSALEGERKQITVLFADLKGSMELLADRDPEEARRILDPVLEQMMEAVHRYEGTVNQVMGDGIMALFGAPLAHEDHAVRACYAELRMQESVKRHAAEMRRTTGVALAIRVGLNSGEVVVRWHLLGHRIARGGLLLGQQASSDRGRRTVSPARRVTAGLQDGEVPEGDRAAPRLPGSGRAAGREDVQHYENPPAI
jgi:Adenylate and Guanylate cyclase catalytic domain/zinc-ribbon domain